VNHPIAVQLKLDCHFRANLALSCCVTGLVGPDGERFGWPVSTRCHVTVCHATLRHATLCHVTFCGVTSQYVTQRRAMTRYVTSLCFTPRRSARPKRSHFRAPVRLLLRHRDVNCDNQLLLTLACDLLHCDVPPCCDTTCCSPT
jgi:hypothetical protein